MADVIARTDMDSAHGRRMLKEIREMWDEWDIQEDADSTVKKIFKRTSINGVRIFGGIFDPLPSPYSNFIY